MTPWAREPYYRGSSTARRQRHHAKAHTTPTELTSHRDVATVGSLARESLADRLGRSREPVPRELEDDALVDYFGVERSDFPRVLQAGKGRALGVSGRTEEARDAATIISDAALPDQRWPGKPPEEECEHGLRTRRTYTEVEGTETYQIILSDGGPKPWPKLTPRQRDIIEQRQREQGGMASQLAGLPRVPASGSFPIGGL